MPAAAVLTGHHSGYSNKAYPTYLHMLVEWLQNKIPGICQGFFVARRGIEPLIPP